MNFPPLCYVEKKECLPFSGNSYFIPVIDTVNQNLLPKTSTVKPKKMLEFLLF